jgi:sugar O-acyltransferase (sialic acid O-acetyltransferase NeuD family)
MRSVSAVRTKFGPGWPRLMETSVPTRPELADTAEGRPDEGPPTCAFDRAASGTVTDFIFFGVGSPVLIDVEESLYRAGYSVPAGIWNRPGPSHASATVRLLQPQDLTDAMRRLPFLVPLFTPANRQAAAREATACGLSRPFTLIDPTVSMPRRMQIADGCYINAGCSFGGGSSFGRFVFINRGTSVGHHACLDDFVSLGPGVTIAGDVTIGLGSMIGTGATILPGVSIGGNAVVGAGSVVARDVPGGCLVLGNPARIVRSDIGGYKGLRVV